MKAIFALAAATFITAAVAQEAPKPQFRSSDSASKEAAPKEAESKDSTLKLEPAAKSEPLGLIPDTLVPVPKPKGTALTEPSGLEEGTMKEQKIDKTTAASDELNQRIKMRDLKTKVDRDPKVAGELERANVAKTDYEKREALRSYYTMLYDKIAKLDPSLQKRANDAKSRMTHRLDQTRVAPTEPIEPEERVSAR